MNELLNELQQLFATKPISMTGAVFLGIGIVFAVLGSISYRFRAFTNKKAWDGKTKPFIIMSILCLLVGGVLFAIGLMPTI